MTRVTASFDQSLPVLLRAVRTLHQKQLLRDRIIGLVFLALSLLALIYSPWFAALLAITGLLLWLGWLDPQLMQARLLFRRNPDLRHRVDISADDGGLTFNAPASSLRMEWARYQRLVEGTDVIVLVYGKDMLHGIPVEAFANAGDLETFRSLAIAGIGAAKPAETLRTSR